MDHNTVNPHAAAQDGESIADATIRSIKRDAWVEGFAAAKSEDPEGPFQRGVEQGYTLARKRFNKTLRRMGREAPTESLENVDGRGSE